MQTDTVMTHGSAGLSPSVAYGTVDSASRSPAGQRAGGQEHGSQASSANQNRRRFHRFTAVKDHLWAGWWDGEEFLLVEAQLQNISQGGVQVAINPSPAPGQPVWFRLEGSAVSQSLQATVLESKWMMLKRRFMVRLMFHMPCPDEVYEEAVYGHSSTAIVRDGD
jgi:hypothetical protein